MKILGVCGAQGALIFKLRKYLVANVEPRPLLYDRGDKQWKANFGNIPKIRTLEEIPKFSGRIDLIIGSPSCGHSSKLSYSRKGSLGKPKEDASLNMFLESIAKFKPRGFVMENLPKLLDLVPVNDLSSSFKEYDIIVHAYSVSVFGNSQITRKRLILIGVHKEHPGKLKRVDFNDIFPVRPSLKTCKELQKFIRPELEFKEPPEKHLTMYHPVEIPRRSMTLAEVEKYWTEEYRDEYRWLMPGQKMMAVPGVYKNLWDEFPLTIRPSSRQFAPDGKIMGTEWFRLIMGFPRSYKLFYDKDDALYWLNKARVTYSKGSVFEVGTWLFRVLRKYKAF